MDYNILRENDIRGVYPNQINGEVALIVGKAFGTYILSKGEKECIVGHDNRLSGDTLNTEVINGVLSTGVNVIDIGICTTPLLNYSSRIMQKPYGIMITASHNPSEDNGFKIFGENYLHLERSELEKFYSLIKSLEFKTGNGEFKKASCIDEYNKMLISKAKIDKPLKVVIDPGNGTTSILVKDVFNNIGIEAVYLNEISDGSFPVHNPDPNVEENLGMLKSKIKEIGADIGLAFDGDGDRFGIVDEKGNMVATDIVMGIIADQIIPKNADKRIIIDIKCSKALVNEVIRAGGEPIMVKNGSAFIETEVFNEGVLFGGEYSGHVFFRDDFDGFDDGVYAGIRMLNILAETNKKCSELYEHMDKYYNTPEIRLEVDDNIKWDIVEKIKGYAISKNYDILTIDGVRVNYGDGFSLIRCSNTSPQITLRFEAKTEEDLDLRKREYLNLVQYYIKN